MHKKRVPIGHPALEVLGYDDALRRDHDTLSLLGLTVANIGKVLAKDLANDLMPSPKASYKALYSA